MRWLGLDWTVSNATISCPSDSYGTFTNGETTCANIPSGVLLSTGNLIILVYQQVLKTFHRISVNKWMEMGHLAHLVMTRSYYH